MIEIEHFGITLKTEKCDLSWQSGLCLILLGVAKTRIVNEVYLNSFEQLSKQILQGLLSVKLKGARRLDTTLIRAYALLDARWPFWPFHLLSSV